MREYGNMGMREFKTNNKSNMMRKGYRMLLILAVVGIGIIFFPVPVVISGMNPQKTIKTIVISSKSFNYGGFIPSQFTCDGGNFSPDLVWSGTPPGTRSLALVCNDPDAPSGNWVHWVLFNIPAHLTHFAEGYLISEGHRKGIKAGKNDFNLLDYSGPCPPRGIHRYYFRIYALDFVITANDGITAKELLRIMEGHILGKGELMGKYQRK